MEKLFIDIARLRTEGKISNEEFTRLAMFAEVLPSPYQGRGIAMLVSIGMLVLLIGILALFPGASTALLLGVSGLGLAFFYVNKKT